MTFCEDGALKVRFQENILQADTTSVMWLTTLHFWIWILVGNACVICSNLLSAFSGDTTDDAIPLSGKKKYVNFISGFVCGRV